MEKLERFSSSLKFRRLMPAAGILLSAIIFLFLLAGCSMKRITINSTALFMDDVVDAFFAEEDLKFTEAAVPANLKLLDGLIKGAEYENDGLLLKGAKLYGMYALGFFEDSYSFRKPDGFCSVVEAEKMIDSPFWIETSK